MAQLNITLNQDEILQLLSANREDAFKTLLQESLNGILSAESTAQLGAEKYDAANTNANHSCYCQNISGIALAAMSNSFFKKYPGGILFSDTRRNGMPG